MPLEAVALCEEEWGQVEPLRSDLMAFCREEFISHVNRFGEELVIGK